MARLPKLQAGAQPVSQPSAPEFWLLLADDDGSLRQLTACGYRKNRAWACELPRNGQPSRQKLPLRGRLRLGWCCLCLKKSPAELPSTHSRGTFALRLPPSPTTTPDAGIGG